MIPSARHLKEVIDRLDSSHEGSSLIGELKVAFTTFEEGLEKIESEQENANLRFDQLSRELRTSRQSIESLQDLQKEIVSICAHDLRSPTSNILSFLSILRDDWSKMSDRKRLDIFERMDRAAHQMLHLIEDLLDMSKIESGKLDLKLETILLSQVCQEVAQNFSGSFSNKKVKNSLHFEHGELRVKLDFSKTLQVLSNLFSNALKFTPEGGEVSVEIRKAERQMRFEIKNTGEGIPSDELDQLFEQFAQVSTQATSGEKGTGLGLTIVKQLVELQGGTIEVKSQLGKGTSFIILFPVAESAQLLNLFRGK